MPSIHSTRPSLAFRLTLAALFSAWPDCTLAEWKITDHPIVTQWAAEVDPNNLLPDYPRPQMVRPEWKSLNGLWDYKVRPTGLRKTSTPELDGQILVPFPIESALSGVKKPVGPENRLWYRRTFTIPKRWQGKRILLHFGAVDWNAQVAINGHIVGSHQGGYDPFTLDITKALKPFIEEDAIVVQVRDPTDTGTQPRGKQILKPHGIWYTAVTGIWQTVWLEAVPNASITRLKMTPDIDAGLLRLVVEGGGTTAGHTIEAIALEGDQVVAKSSGGFVGPIELSIQDAKLWSPDAPFLYDLVVRLKSGDETVDEVTSYFGMRKISLDEDANGHKRLFLNNKPLFQYGPLDQGWWPDGLYTAPTDEALQYDIEVTKKLGFNMIRKHVKVEPARWYYHCDKLGMLVWQDMPNGDRHVEWNPKGGHDGKEITRSAKSADQYRKELRAMIDTHSNHPSIVCWVPFNEAWGQFDTVGVSEWIKSYDPSRLVNCASGGNDFPVGDIHDLHRYPGPIMPPVGPKRASVLGEFGGLGLPVSGHLLTGKDNWGYKSFKTSATLSTAYEGLIAKLRPLKAAGLAAAVYTQITDVEIEINGLMTYDRAVIKVDPEWMRKLNRSLIEEDK